MIGRKSDSSASASALRGRERGGLADIAQEHVRFLHFIERRGEGARDRFLDQPFAQTEAEIAGQDFHEVFAFAGGESGQAILQDFRLRDRAARFLQGIEEFLRVAQSERLGRGPAVERFEGALARVAVAASDAMHLGVA